jgi:hypothetical protein
METFADADVMLAALLDEVVAAPWRSAPPTG